MLRKWFAIILVLVLLGSCSGIERNVVSPNSTTSPIPSSPTSVGNADTQPDFPDVIDVKVTPEGPRVFTFDVTISSPYDSPTRYADAWRVTGIDGTVYGIRELLHDHAGEQPFTRSLNGVEIPDDVDDVIVEGRDLVNGWGGQTARVRLP